MVVAAKTLTVVIVFAALTVQFPRAVGDAQADTGGTQAVLAVKAAAWCLRSHHEQAAKHVAPTPFQNWSRRC
jgi:hypothetical protein